MLTATIVVLFLWEFLPCIHTLAPKGRKEGYHSLFFKSDKMASLMLW